jgi:ketosteroid isomerase-like protein
MKKYSLVLLSVVLAPALIFCQDKNNEAEFLMQCDREFDLRTAEKGLEGWVSFFAPNGSMVGDTSRPVTGLSDIRKVMKPLFEDTTFALRWSPEKSGMLIPGLIGYTAGKYVRHKREKSGKLTERRGIYSTLWMKQPDGSWKVVFDTGQDDGQASRTE